MRLITSPVTLVNVDIEKFEGICSGTETDEDSEETIENLDDHAHAAHISKVCSFYIY